jgi:hypothetical protein
MEMSRLSLLGGWCEFHGLMVMAVRVLHGYFFLLEHVEDLFWLDLIEKITDVQSVSCWQCHDEAADVAVYCLVKV